MSLHTPVCEVLGIQYPIALAGMGGASTPALAAAVSNAGGLGILGAAGCGPELLKAWIDETRSATDKPFGVDTLLPASVRRASAWRSWSAWCSHSNTHPGAGAGVPSIGSRQTRAPHWWIPSATK